MHACKHTVLHMYWRYQGCPSVTSLVMVMGEKKNVYKLVLAKIGFKKLIVFLSAFFLYFKIYRPNIYIFNRDY